MVTDPTHGPIVEEQSALMNEVALALDRLFNGDATGKDRKVCFTLLSCYFGEASDGRVNYISNGKRSDMMTMMRELVSRFEKQERIE